MALLQRWEDFIVQELANGELATLTTLDPIAPPAPSEEAPESKVARTAIHKALRSLSSKLSSTTVKEEVDSPSYILVSGTRQPSDSIITNAIDSWGSNGFVNYYGLQRFGHSAKSKSFEIGKHLLRGEWAHAIDLILVPTFAALIILSPALCQSRTTLLCSTSSRVSLKDLHRRCPKALPRTAAPQRVSVWRA
ncbi:hypothetical protein X801_03976 [Opisthorchis viverrini]|uniref:TRUD domain-containing protein n=1 Tax=Opisthorchis viverrini TaxID=6198 RepID=A0A1S8X0G4_OPIVI|nr:hypothetical protein X801_03976 [Opisthorchis viverrini]